MRKNNKNETEIWKKIVGYPNYKISSFGLVKNIKRKSSTKGYNKKGSMRITLSCENKKPKEFLLHRLIITTFKPDITGKYKVVHINGDKTDNILSNLKIKKTKTFVLNKDYKKLSRKSIKKKLTKYNIELNDDEKWKQIKYFDKYIISSFGRVLNISNGKYNKLQKNTDEYYVAYLQCTKNKSRKNYHVHKLVAEIFNPNNNIKDGDIWHVKHIDGDKNNNNVDNLKWIKFSKDLKKKPTIKDLSKKNEIWKDIENCPNYNISNIGRMINNKYMKILKYKPRKDGYILAQMTDYNGNKKAKLVHRLVAEAFIDNPNNYRIVNHKNGVKYDNIVSNLEWSTYSKNTKHAYKIGLIKKIKAKHIVKGKPIIQLSMDRTIIKEYPSIKLATKEIGYKNKYRISDAVCGRSNTTGYIWKYKKLEDLQGEVWKPVNLEKYKHYEISNLGRLKNENGNLLHPGTTNGYYRVTLSNNKCKKGISIHQLVALTFSDNPDNCKVVNHKDGNKLNNKADNIEWCTHSQNTLHYHKNKNTK